MITAMINGLIIFSAKFKSKIMIKKRRFKKKTKKKKKKKGKKTK